MQKLEDIKIREAERKDIFQIKEHTVWRTLTSAYPNDFEKDGFDDKLFNCILAESSSGEILGFVIYIIWYRSWEGKSIHIEEIKIGPNYRRKGVGTKFIKFLAKKCIQENFARLTIEANWEEEELKFLTKLGAINFTGEEGWQNYGFHFQALKQISNS